IRKDCLYCDAATDPKRMAYRTVLDTLFHALVRYAAPVLVFTSEEVWQTRFPDADSVHFSDWPSLPDLGHNEGIVNKWRRLRELRQPVLAVIEGWRRDKKIGSSLEARVQVVSSDVAGQQAMTSMDFAEICIVSELTVSEMVEDNDNANCSVTANHKCGRCWRHLPEVVEDGALCGRCADVVGGE
ncbi:MAG: class I tRNA ligase family protein, partial [Sphingorhabdus sp.]|nr:class I tRNA ligase family protein [Sphingorhabdus sp.]